MHGFVGGLGVTAVMNNDERPFSRQTLGDGAPDATTAARDDGDLFFQLHTSSSVFMIADTARRLRVIRPMGSYSRRKGFLMVDRITRFVIWVYRFFLKSSLENNLLSATIY